jgi:hypothetical protein
VARTLRHITCCLLLACALGLAAQADPLPLGYHPEVGAGSAYDIAVTARLDYPLGKDVPVTADLKFGSSPKEPAEDGSQPLFFFVEEGDFQVMGRKWDFSDQTMNWEWNLTESRQIIASTSKATGLLALVELFFRIVYVVELPADPVEVGDTWETERSVESGDSTVETRAAHTLVELRPGEDGRELAVIASELEIPVDVVFVGSRFAGTFEGTATTEIDVATGEVEGVEVEGSAVLVNEGGSLDLTLREISIDMVRTGGVTATQAEEWRELAEQRRGLSDSGFIDAILNANVSDYLEDDWSVVFPRFGNTAADGTVLGAGVVGRYDSNFLYELDGMYGTTSNRGLVAFSLTRGYPIQPKDQQFLSFSNLDGGERLQVGVTRYSGRQLGSRGIGRLRWGLSATYSDLVPIPPRLTDRGRANYVTASLTRFRTGESAVGPKSLDWEGVLAANFGGQSVGGDYDFTQVSASLLGFYHLDTDRTWAARLRVSSALGNPPDAFRTSLVSRRILRGFALGDAPLVRHSVAGSLEYRFRIDTPPFFDDLGVRDWWGAVFVDAGIGGNSYRGLLRSKVYADLGVTGRARVKYLGIPIYVWASMAWPVSGRTGGPRVSLGIDWAF